jgi:Zn-dependent protease
MDGFKRRLNESVQLKLSFTLSLAILSVALVAGIFSFLSAFDEAHELQDDVLRQVAHLMERQHLAPTQHAAMSGLKDVDEESRVIVQQLNTGTASITTENVDNGGCFHYRQRWLMGYIHSLLVAKRSVCWSKRRWMVSELLYPKRQASAMKLRAMAH